MPRAASTSLLAPVVALACLGLAAGRPPLPELLRPHAVELADLLDEGRFAAAAPAFEAALATDGLVQVAGLPDFRRLRERALRSAHACLAEAPRARELTLADGTVRRTLAAGSGAASGEQQGFDHGTTSAPCSAFEAASRELRAAVAAAADAFAERLGGLLRAEPSAPFLLERSGGGGYETVAQAVKGGERLEHFHSYRVPLPPADEGQVATPTLDFHVDQGLFIAFVPALLVDAASALQPASVSSGAFIVRTASGQDLHTELREDAVVFLLGDAVNQLAHGTKSGRPLRTPPHAFAMPRLHRSGLHRVWYGMMQLPPPDARSHVGLTFGELRRQIILASEGGGGPGGEAVLAVGCTGRRQARELQAAEGSACNGTQLFCWHRCFDYTPDLSPAACAAKGLRYQCTDNYDQVYPSPPIHGDFWPNCSNSTTVYQPFPTVTQPAGPCPSWAELVGNTSYSSRMVLVPGETMLLWNVVGDALEAKMVHKGTVGWMGIGIENVVGDHGGMLGAHVVMGKNYQDGTGPDINEYHIHPTNTPHRFWSTPLKSGALTDASLTVTGCFSSIQFKTKTIYGVPLNLTKGTMNKLIWALTHRDFPRRDGGGYAGYHSDADGNFSNTWKYRGHVQVDFTADLQTSHASSDASRWALIVATLAVIGLLGRPL